MTVPNDATMSHIAGGITPQASAGGYHTCVLNTEEALSCWGYNEYGQTPIPSGLTSVSQVSSGHFHTCALNTDASVACWGNNQFGQATPPAGLTSVQQVSAGYYHSCALRTDGTVACWGSDGGPLLHVPSGLNSVTQISAGTYDTCARRTDGTVACWGYNHHGQSNIPVDFPSVSQVSVGEDLMCVLTTDGTVVCQGSNDSGQATVPPGLASVSQISAGYYHVCALRSDGTVDCWGSDSFGQATVPSGLTSVAQLTAGTYHTCAVKTDGTMVCWGLDNKGQSTVPSGLDLSVEPQAITFASSPPNPAIVGATYTVTATGGGSGNAVTLSVPTTQAVCSISDNVVTLLAIGSCTIAANQTAGPGYLAAPEAVQTFDVVGGQELEFTSTAPNPAVVGTTYALSAEGGPSGNAITFSSLTETTCRVEGSTAILLQAGTCTVAADQTGGNGYLAAPQTSQSFSVANPQPQTINFTSLPPEPAVAGGTYTVTATGGGSGNPVLFSSVTRTVCFVIGNTVTFIERGTCRVEADQAGNTYYLPAPQVSQAIDIYEPQTITFTSSPPSPGVVGETYSFNATGGLSGNPVTFTSLSPSVCTLSGSTASLQSAGTCIISANQAGGSGYLTAPSKTQSFTVVAPIPQVVNFTSSPPNPAVVGGSYSVNASGGGSGNPVLFSSLTPSACFVIGNTVSFIARATCRIAGDQAGNTYYLPAAQATQTFDIYETQSLAFTSTPPSPGIVGGSYAMTATGSLSGNTMTFSSLSNDVCTVSGSTASLIGAGTCTIAVDQPEGGGYLAAPRQTQSFTVVAPTAQTIVFTSSPPSPAIFGGSYHVTAGGGGSGNPVVFSSLTGTTCSVVGNTVSFAAAGLCTVAANQAGTPLYLEAPEQTQSFTINPAAQIINFTSTPPSGAVVGDSYAIAATGGASGNPVTFSSLTPAVCDLSGSTVNLTSGGTCTIAANQGRTANYLDAPQATQSFGVVEPIAQTISFTSTPPNPSVVGGTYGVSAAGGASGNPVLFSSLTPSVCFVMGHTVSLVARGTCRVAADQAGSRYYLPAVRATQTFDINDVQVIAFTSTPPTPAVVGGAYSVTATGGFSGNPVTFSSLSTSVCTLSGNIASLRGAGTCIIAADQAEGNGYLAAPRKTQSFTVVAPTAQTIVFTSSPPSPAIFGGSYHVTATGGGSGNPVVLSSLTGTTCSIVGNTVSFAAAGVCTIAANQAGTPLYLEAPEQTQSFTINPAAQIINFTSTPPSGAVVGDAYAITATGGASGNPVAFSSLTPAVCNLTGSTANLVSGGTCIIAANQAQNANYLAAPQVTQSFGVVEPITQSINFTSSPPNPAVVGGSYTVNASGGASGNPVLFSSLTPTACFVIGNTVSLITRATCRIAGDQAGNRYYLPAAQATQTFDIYDVQAVTFTSTPPAPAVVGNTYSIAAAGGLSGNPVTFTSLSTSVCTLSGSTASLTGAGTCVIAADQAEGGGYLAAPRKTQSFTVIEPMAQTIAFTSTPPNPPIIGETYVLSATGGASGNPVTFSSLTPGTCGISGTTASFTARGTCTIAANQAGSALYLPASQATQTFVIDTRPVANAGSAQTGLEGSPVSFSAAGSSDADGDAITTYTWDFGDGTVQSVSTPTVQHVYNDNSPSAYVVTLTVRDARGATSLPATTSAMIGNIAPSGSFVPPSPVGEGVMTLSMTGVQDALGDLSTLQYAFDCGDGLGYRAYGASASFACNAADNGTRSVRARVRDKDGAIREYSGTVSVVNVAPTVEIVSAPATGTVGVDYTISYRFSDPGTIDSPWWYQTTWGDGKKVGVTATTTQGSIITQTYRYTSPGTYTITVRVSDKNAGTGTSTRQVTITR
jgi:alpha-tubulin suppressor-like RCC1 family protein